MHFDCRFRYFPQPYEPNLFLREYEIDVISGNDERSFVAGRLAVDFLDMTRVESAGETVLEVCDADSDGWVDVYNSILEVKGRQAQLKEEFDFDDPIYNIAFLRAFVFGPSLQEWRKFIIAHVADMFSFDTATVMRKGHQEFSKPDLAELGFWSISGTDLLFRPNTHRHPYDPVQEERDVLDAEACQFDEEFVKKHWNQSKVAEL